MSNWDDADTDAIKQKREFIKQKEKEKRAIMMNRELDDWDKELDKGKVKVVYF